MHTLMPEFFRRLDERPDTLFYRVPRRGDHLDPEAAAWIRSMNDEVLSPGGQFLDLMAGGSTLLSEGSSVVGLGLNHDEMHANHVLGQAIVHDLNLNPILPFSDASFDAVVCTAAVQYMTQPLPTFREVARVLKVGAPFVVAFSNRMYAEKAVLAWRSSDDDAHERLVTTYFAASGSYSIPEVRLHDPVQGVPVRWLMARKTL